MFRELNRIIQQFVFRAGRKPPWERRLRLEPLEMRVVLDAAPGLVDVGVQPDGGLSGKIVYVNGGHGYEFKNTGNQTWTFQRGITNGMIEDLGNQDQSSMLADYLFRAGATVVPLRPIGYQPNEVVLDNVDVGVTFTGAWSNGTATIYFGDAGETPYRFASTAAAETAVATYRPTIPAAGFYPVYAWTRAGPDRVEQLYRVNHSGGSTEVTVNHRRVGNGLVYLGTYYFEAGMEGSVQISNRSGEAGVVIADMIRFGNGMGSINRGGGVSGRSREDELSLYWIQWHVDNATGVPTSSYRTNINSHDGDANVGAIPRYATYMNQQGDGSLSDRVFVSYHSNAGGGRGVVGLHNTSYGGDTPNQVLLASSLAQEINDDLVAHNGQFEHAWSNRGTNVLYESPDFNYGELNNAYINNEFDATIVEVAFHDNVQDAQLMRDPKVRDAVARATYQGMVRYFRAVDGNATPLTMLPGKVPQVQAVSAGPGSVTVAWTAPAANAYNGDAPTGYRIYGSTNGYGFDGGTFVAGGATTSFTFHVLSAAEGAYYFKVAAVNAGGESVASEVVAANPAGTTQRVLIVNGFDRLGRTQNPTQSALGGAIERVRPRQSNSYDYAVQVAAAIEANSAAITVDTASNEMIISGAVPLGAYDAVVWIGGEESTADDTFNPAEQTLVANYLAAGGMLLVTGAEIGWDLDAQGAGAAFYNNQLKADYVADDANTYAVSGESGSIFAGLSFSFDNGAQSYNAEFADVIGATGGSTVALRYATGGVAGVTYTSASTGTRIVHVGFPFETITTGANRAAVMDRVLEYFGFALVIEPTGDFDADADVDGADFLAWQRGLGAAGNATPVQGDSNLDGNVDAADLANWAGQYGSEQSIAAEGTASLSLVALAQAQAAAVVNSPPSKGGVRGGIPRAASAPAQTFAAYQLAYPSDFATSAARLVARRAAIQTMRDAATPSSLDAALLDDAFVDLAWSSSPLR